MENSTNENYSVDSKVSQLIAELLNLYKPKSLTELTFKENSILKYCDFTDYKELKIAPNLNEKFEINELIFNKKQNAITGEFPYIKNSEIYYNEIIFKLLDNLSNNGILALILPYSFSFSRAYSKIRKKIISEFAIDFIIDIKLNNKNTNIKNTLVFIRKGKPNKKIFLGKVDNPNFSIEGFINVYKNNLGDFWVDYAKLNDRLDRNFHDPKHNKLKEYLNENETKKIEELADVLIGRNVEKHFITKKITQTQYISFNKLQNNKILFDLNKEYLNDDILDNRFSHLILKEGDIVFGNRFVSNLYLYTVTKNDPKAVIGNGLAIIRPKYAVGEYIKSYLSFKEGIELLKEQINMKSVRDKMMIIDARQIKLIQIPIIPLKNLNLDSVSDRNISTSNTAELQFIKKEIESTLNNISSESLLIEYIKNRFDKIDEKLFELGEKVDNVIQTLNLLTESIQKVKNLPREDEEKLNKINRLIDDKLSELNFKKDRNGYIEDVKNWFQYWDFLDEASKEFLPSAEYLYDEISNIGSEDYSPFIIQYCRAIENELLKKLFETFHLEIKTIYSEDELKKLLKNEIEIADNKAKEFAKSISKNDSKYTLGQMNYILGLTKNGGSTLKTSKLIQHFRTFILAYYNEMVIEKVYLAKINTITNDFRNKSAHPYILTLDIAKECQVIIREGLNYFFENKIIKS